MFRKVWVLAFFVVPLLAETVGTRVAQNAPTPTTVPAATNAHLPLRFEANEGQVDGGTRFVARTGGGLFLTSDGATLGLPGGQAITIAVDGGRSVEPRARHQLETRSSYFIGNDPSRWLAGIRNWGEVVYPSVVDGVDFVFHGEDGQLEYDFVVAPGADPSAIVVRFDGATGIDVAPGGALAIETPAGRLVQPPPRVYQRTEDGIERAVGASYRLLGGTKVAFAFDRWDHERALVIDPVLQYSAVLGTGLETTGGIAVDASGNAYLTGRTSSLAFPTASPLQASNKGASDVFVAKMNPQGTALLWATYLGGAQSDGAASVDVDESANVYVAGDTASNDFPTVGPLQATRAGAGDAFVAKIAASGASLVYSTFLGGTQTDAARTVRVDASGQAHVVGETISTDFPTHLPLQNAYAGGTVDTFVALLAASGSALVYSTYLGGNAEDRAPSGGVAVDASGATYITGWTTGTFPVTSSASFNQRNGPSDAYVAKIAPTGTLAWSILLGGSNDDRGYGITTDTAGAVYVTGVTGSADFPVKNSMQPYQELGDGFVTKLESDGSALVYSTLVGGPDDDQVHGSIGVDANGCVAFGGSTRSETGFLLVNPVQSSHAGGTDGFVAKLNATGSAFVFATYLGSSVDDNVKGVALDGAGDVYAYGDTGSRAFPSTPPWNDGTESGAAFFVSKLATPPLVGAPSLVTVPPTQTQTFTASGGSPPYTFALTASPSGGTITKAGVYTAGSTANVIDAVEVRDRGGLVSSMRAFVGTPLAITPQKPSIGPDSSITFTAAGGTGSGLVWSLSRNESHGSIVPSSGVYRSGKTAQVFDQVQVTDSIGNTATTDINVGGSLAITSPPIPIPPNAKATISATGGSGFYIWSMSAAPSGGTIDPLSGAYHAGTTPSVTDQVSVKDSEGKEAILDLPVGPGVSIKPESIVIGLDEKLALEAVGGSNNGYVWSLTQNGSGATLGEGHVLVAGKRQGTEVVSVNDDLGNGASAQITIIDRTLTEPDTFGGGGGCAIKRSPASTPALSLALGALVTAALCRRSRRRQVPQS